MYGFHSGTKTPPPQGVIMLSLEVNQHQEGKHFPCSQPESYVRNWQWNNAWYLNQERPVQNLGLKEVSTGLLGGVSSTT